MKELDKLLAKRKALVDKKYAADNFRLPISIGGFAFFMMRKYEKQLLIEFLTTPSKRLQEEIDEIDKKLSVGIEEQRGFVCVKFKEEYQGESIE